MSATVDRSRRSLVAGAAGMGAWVALMSTPLLAPKASRRMLENISSWNDLTQRALFDGTRLAPIHTASEITVPFPFNGFYPESLAPIVDRQTWRLTIEGRSAKPLSLSLSDLRELESESQITRLICIEGWSAIGEWAGPTLGSLLKLVQADLTSRHIALYCADGYWTSIDMASALHPQTILALDFLRRPLSPAFGQPARLRIPTKLGFKNAKHVERIVVGDEWVGGYWEDQGYNWFAGL